MNCEEKVRDSEKAEIFSVLFEINNSSELIRLIVLLWPLEEKANTRASLGDSTQ